MNFEKAFEKIRENLERIFGLELSEEMSPSELVDVMSEIKLDNFLATSDVADFATVEGVAQLSDKLNNLQEKLFEFMKNNALEMEQLEDKFDNKLGDISAEINSLKGIKSTMQKDVDVVQVLGKKTEENEISISIDELFGNKITTV